MLRPNKISPKKPCPFCGAFLENEAPSTIWCHPQNGCLLVSVVLQENSRLLSGIRAMTHKGRRCQTMLNKLFFPRNSLKRALHSVSSGNKLRLPVKIAKCSGYKL